MDWLDRIISLYVFICDSYENELYFVDNGINANCIILLKPA